MLTINNTLNNVRDSIFRNIHSHNLIYNTCWEDPRCDREILQFKKDSKIVMITSAGCNALDYLLDDPMELHAIDMNPRQNALLDLKMAGFQSLSFQDFFQFFGNGFHPNAKKVYEDQMRKYLPDYARAIWDKKIKYFNGEGLKKSFYFYGTSGTFAFIFYKYLQTQPKLRNKIMQLLEAETLEEQTEIYEKIEPKLITFLLRWLMNRHITLTMLGIPRAQRQLIVDKYTDGVAGFATECLRNVFTKLPVKDNYFWRLYITGKYTPECCPNYLREENFQILKERISKIKIYTSTIHDFLKNNPDQYTHYIILDHQDWLAAHNIPALEEEWQLILKNSKPGSKVLMRSAALEIDFIPEFTKPKIVFDEELARQMHPQDRVGTYGSVMIGTVQ